MRLPRYSVVDVAWSNQGQGEVALIGMFLS
jgi:hypothetical protein